MPLGPATHYGARMRHVGTLIAALVIAPLAWLLIAFGQDRSAVAFSADTLHPGDFVRPLQYLAAAGLLLGIIATLRFSPLGAIVSGVAYLSSYALLLVAPDGVVKAVSHHVSIAGHRADLALPVRTGTTVVMGALLVVAAASIGRWRRWPRPAADTYAPEPAFDRPAFDRPAFDRPLGADGLGLLPPPPPGPPAEPELVARYSTRAEPGTGTGSPAGWSAGPRRPFEEARW